MADFDEQSKKVRNLIFAASRIAGATSFATEDFAAAVKDLHTALKALEKK